MPVFFSFFRHRLVSLWGVAVWSVVVAGGFAALTSYTAREGEALPPPARWPEETKLSRSKTQPTLVVFAHPRCPCTRATLEELAQILEKIPERPATQVVFLQPGNASTDWGPTGSLWQFAVAIPGVTVHADPEGKEAARFGALTSGQTLLFGVGGDLLFRGGITPGRGEHGANPGSDRILALLRTGGRMAASTPIFGCPMFAGGGSSR